jgi:hypothetical protein
MSQNEQLNLLLPHLYRNLINHRNISTLLSLATTCKNFHRRYCESSISNHVDTLKKLYSNIQTMWEQQDAGIWTPIPHVNLAFKDKDVHIYPSVSFRLWNCDVSRTILSDGKAGITFNVSIKDGRLQPQDVVELEQMIVFPTLLKNKMYGKTSKLMFQIKYWIEILKWDWSIQFNNGILVCSYPVT